MAAADSIGIWRHGAVTGGTRLRERGVGPIAVGALCLQLPGAGCGQYGDINRIRHRTEQKERFLKPLLAGEIRSCFSMTEPENPGSNPTWMSSTAVRDEDEYVIEGHKWFTSSADGASFCHCHGCHRP